MWKKVDAILSHLPWRCWGGATRRDPALDRTLQSQVAAPHAALQLDIRWTASLPGSVVQALQNKPDHEQVAEFVKQAGHTARLTAEEDTVGCQLRLLELVVNKLHSSQSGSC